MATNKCPSENDTAETLQTWNKLVSTAKKAGFREGAADGRNSVYQKSFDEGYTHGFKNGFAIGKYKGALSFLPNLPSEPNLEKSRRGLCRICMDEELLQGTTKEAINIQTQFSVSILEKLHSTYSPTINVTLEKNLT